jgi:ATPase subunit of ABC transporter with duplicated ATPase domains
MRWGVIEWLDKQPNGVTAHDAAQWFHVHHQTIGFWMRELISQGKIVKVLNGRYARYCTRRWAQDLRETLARVSAEREKARRKAAQNARTTRRGKAGAKRAPRVLSIERRVVRVIQAVAAPTVETRAVPWVFALGERA